MRVADAWVDLFSNALPPMSPWAWFGDRSHGNVVGRRETSGIYGGLIAEVLKRE